MPELPEVETTVRQIKKATKGLTIKDVWTDYGSVFHRGKENIKDGPYFERFRKAVVGKKITDTSRRGKNVLIHLSGDITILAHMKMSGHFLYGKYKRSQFTWIPDETSKGLHDPYNRFIHLVFTLSNGKHLAFSDLRKFAKVAFFNEKERDAVLDLSLIGPEPLDKNFTLKLFKERLLKRPNGKIKPVLMDQNIIAGIGNIYSDEMLFETGLNPEESVSNISPAEFKKMYDSMKKILLYSISIGGDSASDFRDLEGKRGGFQNKHKAYRRTGMLCPKRECSGRIVRKVVAGRSAHFCDRHQQLKARRSAVS